MIRKLIASMCRCCPHHCPKKERYILLNLVGIVYTWVVIILLFNIGSDACYKLDGDQCHYYIGAGVFIVAECALNFLCFHFFAYRNRLEFILPSAASKSAETPLLRDDSSMKESKFTKFCSKCNRAAPIRSHHCFLCQYCVMKSDHHCFALGGCVGFGNQRFFIVFLFWSIMGAVLGTWMCARYVDAFVIRWSIFGIFDYFFPLAILKWAIVQHCKLTDLGYVIVVTAGYTAFLGASLFFILQWVLIVRGQTLYEAYKKKPAGLYGGNPPLWMRIEYIFGPFWYVNFLVPLPFRNRLDESLNQFLYECQLKKV